MIIEYTYMNIDFRPIEYYVLFFADVLSVINVYMYTIVLHANLSRINLINSNQFKLKRKLRKC